MQLLLALGWTIAMTALVMLTAGWVLIPAIAASLAFGCVIA